MGLSTEVADLRSSSCPRRGDLRSARFGMENGVVLSTAIPAGELVRAYGRESWVSV